MQYENQGEALRQRAVDAIIGTYGLRSQVQRNAALNEQVRAETERLKTLMPGLSDAQAAETALRISQAKNMETAQEREAGRRLRAAAIARQESPEERAQRAAEVQSRFGAGLAEQQAGRVQTGSQFAETLGQRKKEFETELGEKRAGMTDVAIMQPDGTEEIRKIPVSQLAQIMTQQGIQARIVGKEERTEERKEMTEYEKDQDDALKAQEVILGTSKAGPNVNDPATIANISEFNRKSEADFVYGFDKSRQGILGFGSDATYKIPLVDKNGKKLKARDVTRNAKRAGYGTDIEGYIRDHIYKGREMPKLPAR